MTAVEVGTWVGIAAGLAAVITLFVYVRGEARKRAQDDASERARVAGEQFAAGAKSRDDEVALLRSQRDDARDERNQARQRADEFERRYNDLRDRRTHE